MKFVTYQVDQRKVLLGMLNRQEDWVFPLTSFEVDYATMQQLISEISDGEMSRLHSAAAMEPALVRGAAPMHDVTLLAPIPKPAQDVICLGINYLEHAKESARFHAEAFGKERPDAVYFSKRANYATAPGAPIPCHAPLVDSLDYEAELAVIIGKEARNVAAQHARDYIFGYTIINDVSARNVQTRHKQWFFGKSLDGFLPMGPYLVTRDELPYPPKLAIQSKVNGQLRQDSNTEKMIFGLDHIISELSSGMTLLPGTIIATGTPAGVGMGMIPPAFLHKGDVVQCIIEGIGTLENTIGD